MIGPSQSDMSLLVGLAVIGAIVTAPLWVPVLVIMWLFDRLTRRA